jgi:hypothetical protein
VRYQFPARITDFVLARWDFGLMAYLTMAFLFMWYTHWCGSKKEIEYHQIMHKAFRDKVNSPKSN